MSANPQDEMRRLAEREDPAALTQRAKILLAAREAAPDVNGATALLVSAFERGDAEAAAILATLEAVGAGRPQSWERALNYLQLAAERGDDRARRQLLLMCHRFEGVPAPENGAVLSWATLRAEVDIAALTGAPPRKSLVDSPRIRVVEGFASAAECDWLTALARPRIRPAAMFDPRTGEGHRESGRSNSAVELGLLEMDVVVQVIRTRIAAATTLPVQVYEAPQVLHYAVGQTFKSHHDYLDPRIPAYTANLAQLGQRIATFLLYLNDDYEGGETDFPAIGLRHRGRKGDALFFANVTTAGLPDPLTLHAGLPPTLGEKWVLSQWIRDRSPGAPSRG